ncbi:MAG: permease [Bacillota bacterium]|nr:permease [Bacillota bacterium]
MKKLDSSLASLVAAGVLAGSVWLVSPARGAVVVHVAWNALAISWLIILSVFVYIGLLQAWVKPAAMARWLGRSSGAKGFALASTLGIFLGGSLVTVFPLLAALRQKGARVGVLAALVTAWGGKAPLLPLEGRFLGWQFALVRMVMVMLMAALVGVGVERLVGERQEGGTSSVPG